MTQWMTFVFAVVATTVAIVESRAIPAEPISMMLDPYGNPIVFLREKRTAMHPYPHRAMMFTGYYRPVRRSSNDGQATGVFAQGNAISGEAFFGGMQAPHLKGGPEPIEEPEVSSAEAQAAPGSEESFNEGQIPVQGENEYQPEEPQYQDEHHRQGDHPNQEEHHHEDERHDQEEEQHRDVLPPQEQPIPEPAPALPTEAPIAATPVEESVSSNTEVSANRPKVQHGKKGKKTPVIIEDDSEEDEFDDEEAVMPFIPFKGNRRRQNYPNLNNFFPMVFSFPGVAGRAGSSGSPPGAITAIANSYSTGKGGVASSVATAYGGSPNGKKRRTPTTEE